MNKDKYPFSVRCILNFLRKCNKKRRVVGQVPTTPCVFLCRHRDIKGVMWAFVDIKEKVRPWMLDCLCEYKSAKEHFYSYTFLKRKPKNQVFRFLFSPVCALFLVFFSKRLLAIPVYRKDKAGKSINTIKQTVKALENGDNILIFIDTDYADENEKSSGEIYKGFYAVDKLYYRKNKKHIPFVPVFSNDKGSTIREPVYFSEERKDEFYKNIVYGIYNP